MIANQKNDVPNFILFAIKTGNLMEGMLSVCYSNIHCPKYLKERVMIFINNSEMHPHFRGYLLSPEIDTEYPVNLPFF